MADPVRQRIKILQLLLNQENPRFDIQKGQREAIRVMLKDQGEKLHRLAIDIVNLGTNPSDLPMVVSSDKAKGMFTVMEGNRRITALKLLNEPDLAKLASSPAIEKRYRVLSQMFKMNPIDELECVVFPDIQSAEHWIELKHTGENNGIGTVGWDGTAKARFRQRRGKTDPALQVIDFMKSNAKLDNKTQIALDQGKVAVTNINRLLGDPFVRDFLGLEMNSGVISSKLELDETLKGFTKIIKDLANNRISVGDIYHKKDRKKYIQSFQKHEIPNSQKASSKKWALDSPPLKTDKKQLPSKNKRKKPLTTARKFLISVHPRI